MFVLNKQLDSDGFFVANLKLCRVLLMNNANFPWLILVPQVVDAVELTDLIFEQQIELLKEINLVTKILQKRFAPHKINIGALGNVVRQLHVHVIARFENDKAFPKPVWGFETQKYNEKEAEELIAQIKTELLQNE